MNVKQLFDKQLRFENSGHVASLAILHRLRHYFVVNLEPLNTFCSFSLRFCLARFWVSVIPTATGLRIGESYQLRSRVQYRLDSSVLLSHAAPTACEMIYTGLVNHRNCCERSQKAVVRKQKKQTTNISEPFRCASLRDNFSLEVATKKATWDERGRELGCKNNKN